MKVVVVESPAKAKTINRYLGDGYKVLASYGHVCDLPSKDGSVLPDNDFEMKWQISSGSEKHLKDIIAALKGADKLILATDPDRYLLYTSPSPRDKRQSRMPSSA